MNEDEINRCKAALYYNIKEISKEVEEEMDVTISPQVLASVSESVQRQIECYAVDLENFAKHAKRTNVNVDDVKLLVRRNDTLYQHITEMADNLTATTSKKGSKRSRNKQSSVPEDDSN